MLCVLFFLDYYQKDKKCNTIIDTHVKKISNEPISNQPYASSVTSSKAANQISIRKHRTYAKEEDIKTMMDMLPIDSDKVKNLHVEKHILTLKFQYSLYAL